MSAIQWQSLMSNIDPLLEEGHKITISREDLPLESAWIYRVEVSNEAGHIVAIGLGYPLTEAIADAYESTPEKSAEEAASDE